MKYSLIGLKNILKKVLIFLNILLKCLEKNLETE